VHPCARVCSTGRAQLPLPAAPLLLRAPLRWRRALPGILDTHACVHALRACGPTSPWSAVRTMTVLLVSPVLSSASRVFTRYVSVCTTQHAHRVGACVGVCLAGQGVGYSLRGWVPGLGACCRAQGIGDECRRCAQRLHTRTPRACLIRFA
jgi:hypothetical protein